MKILKQLEQKSNPEQISEWLRWLKHNCTGTRCTRCRFYTGDDCPQSLCRIKNIYRELFPNHCRRTCSPTFWVLPEDCNGPDSLDFLYKIEWDERGNPIPELKEGIKLNDSQKIDHLSTTYS